MIPLAVVLTALFNLGANLVVVLVFLLVSGVGPFATWLLFPLLLVPYAVLTTAVALILPALQLALSATRASSGRVAATALFYATPVLYPLEIVSGKLQHILALNPLAPVLRARAQVGDRPVGAEARPRRRAAPCGC